MRKGHVPTVADVPMLPARPIVSAASSAGGSAWLTMTRALRDATATVDIEVALQGNKGIALIHAAVGGTMQAVTLVRCYVSRNLSPWWWVCPVTGKHASALYLIDGRWASRAAHRLTYLSQRRDHPSRALFRYAWANGILERPGKFIPTADLPIQAAT